MKNNSNGESSDLLEKEPTEVIKYLQELRRQEDYGSIGQVMWTVFLLAPTKAPLRKACSKFFDKLSKRERELCEQAS